MKKIIGIVLGSLIVVAASIVAINMYLKHEKKEEKEQAKIDEEKYIAERKESTDFYFIIFNNKYPEAIKIGYNIEAALYSNPVIWKIQMVLSNLPSKTVTLEEAFDREGNEEKYSDEGATHPTYHKFDYDTVLKEYRILFGDSADLESFIDNGRTNGFIPNESTVQYNDKSCQLDYSSKLNGIIIMDCYPYNIASPEYAYAIFSVELPEITVVALKYEKTADGYIYYTKSGIHPLKDISTKSLDHILYMEDRDLPKITYTFKDGESLSENNYILVSIKKSK